jgi:hypothetical protein
MSNILSVFLFSLVLVSCDNNYKTIEINQNVSKNVIKNKRLIKISENLHGLWVSDNFLKNIENSKSVFLSRNYDTKILGFYLDEKSMKSDSPFLEGFTDHEGGYISPIRFNYLKDKFVNNMAKLSKSAFFPDPFELNYNGENILEMYFPKTKTSDTYRKLNSDFQTEMRKLLISGIYKTKNDNSEIHFDKNGKVQNFKEFKYYELVTDFGLNIEYDALILFNNENGGNWSEGEIYKFEIISKNLQLQRVQTNWESMEHEISNEIVILECEN